MTRLALVLSFALLAGCSDPEPLANDGLAGLEVDSLEACFELAESELDFGTAVLLADREVDPGLDVAAVRAELDELGRRLARTAELSTDDEWLVMRMIQEIGLGGEQGLPLGYRVRGQLIHEVLEQRSGNCMGLSATYLAVAERAGIELAGVFVPYHFYVRMPRDGEHPIEIETTSHGYQTEARADDFYFSEQDREASLFGESLSKRQSLAFYVVEVAGVLRREGRPERAIELCKLAIDVLPEVHHAHLGLAWSLGAAEDWERDLVPFHRALTLRPDDADAWFALGHRHKRRGELEKAEEAVRKAIAIDPRYAPYWVLLADTLHDRKEFAGSIEAANAALDIPAVQLHPMRRFELRQEFPDRSELERLAFASLARSHTGRAGELLEDHTLTHDHSHDQHAAHLREIRGSLLRSQLYTALSHAVGGDWETGEPSFHEAQVAIEEDVEWRHDPEVGPLYVRALEYFGPDARRTPDSPRVESIGAGGR